MTDRRTSNLLQDLNFHHLYYFWVVAHEGGVGRAAKRLRLAQPTISSQVKTLERRLGLPLFERRGRGLELTDAGRLAFRYAGDIVNLGRELVDELSGGPGHVERLRVGVAMVVPKLLVRRLLAPLETLDPTPVIVLTEDAPDRLMAELALHEVDVVLSDAPIPPGVSIRAWNHPLGECPLAVFGTPELLERHGRELPGCLDGAPLLLPTVHAAIRRPLERWLAAQGVTPRVVSEFQDSALMKVYGQDGAGFFLAPAVIGDDVQSRYGVLEVGRVPIADRFYAITLERRISNPTIGLLAAGAGKDVFCSPS